MVNQAKIGQLLTKIKQLLNNLQHTSVPHTSPPPLPISLHFTCSHSLDNFRGNFAVKEGKTSTPPPGKVFKE